MDWVFPPFFDDDVAVTDSILLWWVLFESFSVVATTATAVDAAFVLLPFISL